MSGACQPTTYHLPSCARNPPPFPHQTPPAASRAAPSLRRCKSNSVAPLREARAMFASTASLHISGFLAGEKPSRNHASTQPAGDCGNAFSTSSIARVSRTRSPKKFQRFQPGTRRCQRASSTSACAANWRDSANAARNSLSFRGNFSMLKKSRLAPGGATFSNNCNVQKEIQPGAEAGLADAEALARRERCKATSANRLPCRNTWRVSSRPGVSGEVHVAKAIGIGLSVFPVEHKTSLISIPAGYTRRNRLHQAISAYFLRPMMLGKL